MAGFGTQYGTVYGVNTLGVSPPVPPVPVTRAGSIEIKLLARRVLRVFFDESIIIRPELKNVLNYEFIALTSGADPVFAKEIRGYNEQYSIDSHITRFIDIEITPPTLKAIYRLTIEDQKTVNDVTLTSLVGIFRGRLTKADAIGGNMTKLFNKDPGSNISQLFVAISIEDERIGGQGDFKALPVVEPEVLASTYGTATGGTSTYGGGS